MHLFYLTVKPYLLVQTINRVGIHLSALDCMVMVLHQPWEESTEHWISSACLAQRMNVCILVIWKITIEMHKMMFFLWNITPDYKKCPFNSLLINYRWGEDCWYPHSELYLRFFQSLIVLSVLTIPVDKLLCDREK